MTPKILHVRARITDGRPFSFRAGQFIQFVIGERILRQYSICSIPDDVPTIELCIDVSPGGHGSRFAMHLQEGDTIPFRGPFGVFTIPEKEQRPIVFVATGAGIAPIRSMALSLGPDRPFSLLYGNRDERHICYDEDFHHLAKQNANFRYEPTMSAPSDRWDGLRGRVTSILSERNNLAGRPYFICGSPEMVDDTRTVLREKGIEERDIHFEKFL